MKRTCLAVVVTLLLAACSQTPQEATPDLSPQFGTALNDTATDVALNRSGYIFVVGSSSPGYGDETRDPADTDGFLRRYDRDGRLIWARKVGGSLSERVQAVDTDAAGNSYIVWVASKRTGSFTSDVQNYLSKYSTSGTLLWTRKTADFTYNAEVGGQYSSAFVAVDPLGGVYAAGGQQVDELALQKYSSSGTLIWEKRNGNLSIVGSAVASDGSLYLSDTDLIKYSRTGGEVWRKTDVTRSSGLVAVSGTDDVYLLGGDESFGTRFVTKYTSSGTKRWQREVEVSTDNGYVPINGFDADASGNLYIAGFLEEFQAQVDIIVQKFDSEAKPVWLRRIDADIDYANAVSTILGDGIYVAGETSGLVNGSSQGANDAFLLRLNRFGQKVWSR